MSLVTQPLREEHRDLLPQLETVRAAADAIGTAPAEEVASRIDAALAFLSHLLVHAQAEERALYPVVARAMGAPEATATMEREHTEVARLIEQLRGLRARLETGRTDETTERHMRLVLYGLFVLVGVHFAKEEEVYLPILDERLTADEGAAMFQEMEREAAAAAARLH